MLRIDSVPEESYKWWFYSPLLSVFLLRIFHMPEIVLCFVLSAHFPFIRLYFSSRGGIKSPGSLSYLVVDDRICPCSPLTGDFLVTRPPLLLPRGTKSPAPFSFLLRSLDGRVFIRGLYLPIAGLAGDFFVPRFRLLFPGPGGGGIKSPGSFCFCRCSRQVFSLLNCS